MANEITNYKCPSCTGPLRFDGESGKLVCDYCGGSFEVSEIEKLYAEENAKNAASEKTEDEKTYAEQMWGEGMHGYSCPSCGAELVCDETTSATSCPYCGNTAIMPGSFDGGLKPDYVIPFKLDKEAAVSALKSHYKGKRLLPRAFTEKNHIDEIKGVYVPFRLFDVITDADVMFAATRVGTHREGKYEVTSTDHFHVHRAGKVTFKNIPVDASSKMPDAHMDSIEPFDYSELKPFSMAYLAGFLADKYDISDDECAKRADARSKRSAEQAMAATVIGYTTAAVEASNVKVETESSKYALLPVWMLSTQWNGQNFLFAMNGQTGSLVGDLPTDKGMFWKWFGIIAAPIAAVMALLLFL